MEISDAHDLDRRTDLLFLATAIRCELGEGIVFSGAARCAGDGLSGSIFNSGAAGGLLADAMRIATVGASKNVQARS